MRAGLSVGCEATCLEGCRYLKANSDCGVVSEFGACRPRNSRMFSLGITQHDVTHTTCNFECVGCVSSTDPDAFAAIGWCKITGKPSRSGFIPDGKRAGPLVTKLASNTQRIADGVIVVAL